MKLSLSEYKEFLLSGKELIVRFNDFLGLLNKEFHDPKMSEKLRTLARNGFKIATGKSFEGWVGMSYTLLDRFDAALDTSGKEEIVRSVKNMRIDLMSYKRFQSCLQQASKETKQFFQDQETISDTDEVFVNTGGTLLSELVNWVNELYNPQATGRILSETKPINQGGG